MPRYTVTVRLGMPLQKHTGKRLKGNEVMKVECETSGMALKAKEHSEYHVGNIEVRPRRCTIGPVLFDEVQNPLAANFEVTATILYCESCFCTIAVMFS